MWNFERLNFGEARHITGDNPQPFKIAHLIAAVKQKLHPHTNPQERYASDCRVLKWLDKIALSQFLHPRPERPYPRQNNLLRDFKITPILNHTHVLHTQMTERV